MKVLVEGGNQEVIDKLNELGLEELEIVTEGEDIKLSEEYQEILMQADDVAGANKVLAEAFISQNAEKFFRMDNMNVNPMKINQKKLKKRRAKNKMARKSRQINYAKAKSKRKSHA